MQRAPGRLMRGIERLLAAALLATIALNFANYDALVAAARRNRK